MQMKCLMERVNPIDFALLLVPGHLLDDVDFVFVCIDSGEAKKPIVEKLEADDIPFVDVGMGIQIVDDKLLGIVRVTTNTPNKRDHFRDNVGFTDGDIDEAYSKNMV